MRFPHFPAAAPCASGGQGQDAGAAVTTWAMVIRHHGAGWELRQLQFQEMRFPHLLAM